LNTQIIKRIIGLPGENIEYKDCKLYINGKEQEDFVKECITSDFTLEDLYSYVMIPEDYYFVMGDNRTGSSDSRDYRIGLIKKDQILGKANYRLYPFNRFGSLKK
jgi:signal peptidase I